MGINLQRSLLFVLFVCAVAGCAAVCNGQHREKFVISAKAGGINAVTGRANVHLKGGSDWQQLNVTDDLEAGDIVRTETGGRVEMLLNPGSYLRIGENSEFELVNNSLDNLEFKLLRGTAIVEATGADDSELMINISTPHTKLAIVRHGLYRLNVVPEDATELIVRKGRVMLNDSQKIKGGNKVVFNASTFMQAKLQEDEKKDRDDIALWSKERAETLAKANRRISDRMLTSAFNSFQNSDWLFGSRSRGFWFFHPRSSCYTFVPFYYGWGSPYGSSYSFSVYNPFYCCGGYRNNGWPAANPNRPYPGGGSPRAGSPGRGNPSGGYGGPGAGQRTPPAITRPTRDPGDSMGRGRKPGMSVIRPERQ